MIGDRYIISVVASSALLMGGCSNRGSEQAADTVVAEEYHADNDIVMTVRSLIDAINVAEPLDSVDYDFEGVLTDGSGRPLYTDLQGAPGVWEVEVLSPSSVMIRNVYLGDLLPDDLEQYVVAGTALTNENKIETDEFADDDEAELAEYQYENVNVRFETRTGRTTNGLEGPLFTIRLSLSPSK